MHTKRKYYSIYAVATNQLQNMHDTPQEAVSTICWEPGWKGSSYLSSALLMTDIRQIRKKQAETGKASWSLCYFSPRTKTKVLLWPPGSYMICSAPLLHFHLCISPCFLGCSHAGLLLFFKYTEHAHVAVTLKWLFLLLGDIHSLFAKETWVERRFDASLIIQY